MIYPIHAGLLPVHTNISRPRASHVHVLIHAHDGCGLMDFSQVHAHDRLQKSMSRCVTKHQMPATPRRGRSIYFDSSNSMHDAMPIRPGRRHKRTGSASTIRPPDQQFQAGRFVHVQTPCLSTTLHHHVRSTSTCGHHARSSSGRPNKPTNRRPADHLCVLHGRRTGATQVSHLASSVFTERTSHISITGG